ncbi:MAG: holin, BlyA family protein [Lachnospiraceae bacterium]|nr:holin, BlyA family protein [Lachnospiraceae bacterium]
MKLMKQFLMEEDGMGVIEVILIIVVLIGLVLIFKNQLTTLINSLLSKVRNKANTV